MSDFLEQIKMRATDAQKRYTEVQAKLQAVQLEMNAAQQEYLSWTKAAECETRREQAATPLFNVPTEAQAAAATEPEVAVSEGNKTDLVRDFLRSKPQGMRPGDIWEELKVQIPRPYLYSVLKRLKDRDEVIIRRGKYYFKPIAQGQTIQ